MGWIFGNKAQRGDGDKRPAGSARNTVQRGSGITASKRRFAIGKQMTAVIAVACLLIGVGGTAIVLAPHPPKVLADANPNASAAIETQQVNDARSVTINAEEVSMAPVVAPRSGMVTSSNCKPGAELKSGQSLMNIDGRAVMMLATAEPLWRSLKVGDTGSDAESLNNALKSLGVGEVSGNAVTEATIAAFKQASANAGAPLDKNVNVIAVSDAAWLPADGVKVSGCPAPVGQMIGASQPIAQLPDMASSAQAQSLPTGAAAGERVIQAGDATIDIDAQGAVGDLTAFSRSSAFIQSAANQSGVRQVNVQWVLKNPVTVGVVPAAAIGTMGGADVSTGAVQACIVVTNEASEDTGADTTVPVTIVGSMLGRTYVQNARDGGIPAGFVRLDPRAGDCS